MLLLGRGPVVRRIRKAFADNGPSLDPFVPGLPVALGPELPKLAPLGIEAILNAGQARAVASSVDDGAPIGLVADPPSL